MVNVQLSEFDRKILDKLASKLMSISELAKVIGEDRQFTRGLLESLRHRGILTKTDVGRSTVYQINIDYKPKK